jgi:hypothetical protein
MSQQRTTGQAYGSDGTGTIVFLGVVGLALYLFVTFIGLPALAVTLDILADMVAVPQSFIALDWTNLFWSVMLGTLTGLLVGLVRLLFKRKDFEEVVALVPSSQMVTAARLGFTFVVLHMVIGGLSAVVVGLMRLVSPIAFLRVPAAVPFSPTAPPEVAAAFYNHAGSSVTTGAMSFLTGAGLLNGGGAPPAGWDLFALFALIAFLIAIFTILLSVVATWSLAGIASVAVSGGIKSASKVFGLRLFLVIVAISSRRPDGWAYSRLTADQRAEALEGLTLVWARRALRTGFTSGLWVGVVQAAVAVTCIQAARGIVASALGPPPQLYRTMMRPPGGKVVHLELQGGDVLIRGADETQLVNPGTRAAVQYLPRGSIHLSPDQRFIVLGTGYGYEFLNRGTNSRSQLITGQQAHFVQGQRVAVRFDSQISLYTPSGGRILEFAKPAEDIGWAVEIATAPSANIVAAAYMRSASGGLVIWSLETGAIKHTLRLDAPPRAVALSPWGSVLAVAVGDRIDLWDVNVGRKMQSLLGHTQPVRKLVFSPDGDLLASIDDGTKRPFGEAHIRLWQATNGRALHQVGVRPQSNYPPLLAVSSEHLVAGDEDGASISVWSIK